VDIRNETGESAATLVAAEVTHRVFGGGRARYRTVAIRHTRFGYYVNIDWGVAEEDYTGHAAICCRVAFPRRRE